MTNRLFIAGMNHRPGAEALVRAQPPGSDVELRREPENPHDPNAIQVWVAEQHVGYVRGYQAKLLAPEFDRDLGNGGPLMGKLAFTDNSAVPVVDVEGW